MTAESARLARIRADVAASTVPLPIGAIGNGPADGLCQPCGTTAEHWRPAAYPTAPPGVCLGCGGPLDHIAQT